MSYYQRGGRGGRGGRGRGGRGRGRGRGNCFKCGQPGHISRNCPNQGGGGGGYRRGGGGGYRGGGGGYRGGRGGRGGYQQQYGGGGGGYRGRGGRGGYRGRGGRGGRGRGRGRGGGDKFGGTAKSDRFQDITSTDLNSEVNKFNVLDPPGPQQVKCWIYKNGWSRVQSLSHGASYFYHQDTKETRPFGNTPDECKGERPIDDKWQDQGSRFTKAPPASCWDNAALNQDRKLIPNIVTNAYLLNGGWIENKVHTYLVEFDPVLDTKDVLERRNIVLGVSGKEKRRNNQFLMNMFGYWAFDNHKFFSMGRNAYKPVKVVTELNGDYTVKFVYQQSVYFDEEDTIPLTEEEQLLNIFKRKAMRQAGFNNVGDKWFYRDATNPPNNALLPKRLGKCTILNGFQCSMRIKPPHHNKKRGVFKADLANKLVSARNVNQVIYDILQGFNNNYNDPAFQREVKKQLEGKFFVLRYSNKSNKIIQLDFECNEKSTFEWRSKDGGLKMVSYADYIYQQYNMRAKQTEVCMIRDNRGSAFLPQFAYLTIRSDEVADVYDEVLYETNKPIQERLNQVDTLVKLINKAQQEETLKAKQSGQDKKGKKKVKKPSSPKEQVSKPSTVATTISTTSSVTSTTVETGSSSQQNDDVDDEKKGREIDFDKEIVRKPIDDLKFGVNITEKSIITDAMRLDYPTFIYRSQDYNYNNIDRRVYLENIPKWGGAEGTRGFLEDTWPIRQWVIVDDQRSYNADNIYKLWQKYCQKRGFDPYEGPLPEPQIERINMSPRRGGGGGGGYNDDDGTREYRQIAKGNWDLIFLILPVGTTGSEIKAKFTKCVQSQKGNKGKGSLVQCILESNCNNLSAVWGAIEDALAKFGNIMFRVEPPIPKNSPYKGKVDRIWTIGLDVSHTTKGKKPSTAMMVLQTLPFYGTHRGMRCIAHLNKPRTEVIPYVAMVTMIHEALMKEEKTLLNEKRRPAIFMIFRDGVPDNALKEVHSKEVVGITRGIRLMRDYLKAKYKIKWKPKIQFIIVSKSPIEKFGVLENGHHAQPLQHPAVVFRGITSQKLWDFFMWNYHPKKRSKIDWIKPLRYVCLKDEMKLSEVKNGPCGLFEIINTLFYTYCFSIPFPLGGTSQPGPIVYAKHYAETFSQMILSSDSSLKDLKIAKNLQTRPQIINNLMELKDILKDNGN